ncbi:MAG: BspA family leucine-rich repeat surface protein, partial [Gammaproteobacteria bacterium]
VVDNDSIKTEIANGNVNLCTTLVTDMSELFSGNDSFNSEIGFWDSSSVTNMKKMFNQATSFNQDISNWDTSSVTNMEEMFAWTSFNKDISGWDVSNVESFYRTFAYTTAFNQPIGSWDMSSATTISGMFRGSNEQNRSVFNQDINSWDTSDIVVMSEVFAYANFNQNIGNWDVSSVRLLTAMFTYNPNFNQDIGGWDLSSMTDANNLIDGSNYGDAENRMNGVFRNATSFNQDLSAWCVTDITTEPDFFSDNSALTNANKPVWGTCSSDDTTPPVISITGSQTVNLTVGDSYTEAGATATDDTDGDITSSISTSGSVDTSAAGTSSITYTVSDAAGNSATATRTVVVKTPELIIADYRFEGDAQDSSGNSNHGTNNGGVFTTDRFGNQNGAIYFSSASCGTRMDSDIDMSTVINEFSISFWINRTANGCQLPRIFDFYDGGNNSNDWGTAWENGNNKYQGYDEVSNNNNWYHIVHNFNSNGTLTSFVDGVEVDSRNSGKTLPLSGDFALGRMNHPAYDAFNGKLDDVKMYNYALSQSEINVLFGNYANDTTPPVISITGSQTVNLT